MKFFIPYSDALSSVSFLEPQPETISMSIPTILTLPTLDLYSR